MAVTPVPVAAVEIPVELVQARVNNWGWQSVSDGGGATNVWVEVSLGSTPERDEESVCAIGRHRDRFDPDVRNDALEVRDRRESPAVVLDDLGQVVAAEPPLRGYIEVEGEEDDPSACDAEHLTEPAVDVIPVLHREDAYRCVHAVVAERDGLDALESPASQSLARDEQPLRERR